MKKVLLGLVVVGAVIFGAWRMARSSPAEAATTEISMVRRGTLANEVLATGSLAPGDTAQVSWASDGQISQIDVSAGDTVTVGANLAALDASDLQRNVDAAQADLDAANASRASAGAALADLKAGPAAGDVESAKISLDQSKDRRWSAQAQRDATCGRVAEGRGQKVECDSAEASVLQAEDAVKLAQIAYDKAMQGPTDTALAQAREKVTQGASAVTTAQTKLDTAKKALADATLAAPIAGIVSEVDGSVGDRVAAGAVAVVVNDISTFQVEVRVDETDVSHLEVGAPASVTVDAFPGTELSGTVSKIAQIAEVDSGVVLYPVTVIVDPAGADVPLRIGMTAEVSLQTASAQDALVVPLRAVQMVNGQAFVEVVTASPSDLFPAAAGAATDTRSGQAVDASSGPADASAVPDAGSDVGSGGAAAGRGSAGPFGQGRRRGAGFAAGAAGGARFGGAGFANGAGVNGRPRTFSLPAARLNGATQQVPVTVGLKTDTEAQIVDGLSEGQLVVVGTSTVATNAAAAEGRPPGGFGGPGFGFGGFAGGRR